MKKIYAFLASALVALTSVAAPMDLSKATARFTDEGRQAIEQRASQLAVADKMILPEGMELLGTRSYKIGNMLYTLRFMLETENEWYKVLSFVDPNTGELMDPSNMTFADFPWYNVFVLVAGYDTSKGGELVTYLPFYTFWPCKYYHSQQYERAGESIPDDEIDYSMVSLTDMVNGIEKGYCNKFREGQDVGNGGFNPNPYMNGSEIEAFSIITSTFGQLIGCSYMYNGTEGASTYQDGSNIMEYVFRDYNEDTKEIMCSLKYPLVYPTSNGGSRKITLNIAYNGTCRVDFEPQDYNLTGYDVHIFNTGVIKDNDLKGANPYFNPWGPLTRYRVYGALNDLIMVNVADDLTTWNENKVGFQFKESATADEQTDPESQSYFQGTLYSAADAASPENQKWTVATPSYTYSDLFGMYFQEMVPEAGSAIPMYTFNVYDDEGKPVEDIQETYPTYDGFYIWYKGDNESPMPGGVIASNTTNGFEVVGNDLMNNNIVINYKEKIKYHKDPSNAKAYEEIDAVGTAEDVETIVADNAQIRVENGNLIINATENVEVFVYNVNGMLVKALNLVKGDNANVALGNGIFVVKAGNETKKVVL